MNVGRMIFFDKITGQVIIDTGEWKTIAVKKTVDQQIATYKELSERNRETFDVIELEYGQYAQDFREGRLVGVDLDTNIPIFEYPNPEDPDEPIVTPKPMSEQILELKEEQDKTKRMLSESYSAQQDLLELLIELGVL